MPARQHLSKATVSTALNPRPDRSDISSATRERVLALATRPDRRRSARVRRRIGDTGLVSRLDGSGRVATSNMVAKHRA